MSFIICTPIFARTVKSLNFISWSLRDRSRIGVDSRLLNALIDILHKYVIVFKSSLWYCVSRATLQMSLDPN